MRFKLHGLNNEDALRTHLTFREIFGTLIQLINQGGERLEVGDDELLAEGLSEQHDVALDTPDGESTSISKYLYYHH